MVVKGTIFHHKKFVFKDGDIGDKLLILLNTPSENEPCLFAKTTSKKRERPSTPGCIENLKLFFIPAGTAFFKDDTWIELYEIYEIPLDDVKNNPDFKIIGTCDNKLINEIIDCLLLLNQNDITSYHKKLLKPPLDEALQKLKEKWNGH